MTKLNLRPKCGSKTCFQNLSITWRENWVQLKMWFVCSHLSFGQVEVLGELFPLLPDHVLVLLERLLQLQKLVRRKSRPDPFWFPKRQQKFREVGTWWKKNILIMFNKVYNDSIDMVGICVLMAFIWKRGNYGGAAGSGMLGTMPGAATLLNSRN